MGYFANGAEADRFRQRFCATCVNDDPDDGCPVLNAHEDWQHDTGSLPVLDALILQTASHGQKCMMYRPRPELAVESAGQINAFMEAAHAA